MQRILRGLAVIAVFAALVAPSSARAKVSIASQWKARAFDAIERLKNYGKQMKNGGVSAAEEHQLSVWMVVEYAYAAHLDPDLGKSVHKSEPDGGESFHLLLNGGDAGLFDLLYTYDKKGELKGTRVDMLPKGWSVGVLPGSQLLIVFNSNRDAFFFDTTDPFAAIGVPSADVRTNVGRGGKPLVAPTLRSGDR
jgi:hypothetical protein